MEWNRRCFSAGNPRKLKMPAVLKGSVAFQREGRRVEGGSGSPLTRGPISPPLHLQKLHQRDLSRRVALFKVRQLRRRRDSAARPRVKWRRKLMTLWRRRPPLQEGGPLSLSLSLSPQLYATVRTGRRKKAGKRERSRPLCASLSRTFTRAATVNEYLPL